MSNTLAKQDCFLLMSCTRQRLFFTKSGRTSKKITTFPSQVYLTI